MKRRDVPVVKATIPTHELLPEHNSDNPCGLRLSDVAPAEPWESLIGLESIKRVVEPWWRADKEKRA